MSKRLRERKRNSERVRRERGGIEWESIYLDISEKHWLIFDELLITSLHSNLSH